MILRFAYKGSISDKVVVMDTTNKVFVYWEGVQVENPECFINVRNKKDIDKILENIHSEGYALSLKGGF